MYIIFYNIVVQFVVMQNKISIQYYKTPVGELILGAYNGKLCLADWRYRKMRDVTDKRIQKGLQAVYTEEKAPILEQTKTELDAYFNQKLKEFTIPLQLVGTDFQKQVWNALQEIPYGKTESYLGLSKKLQNEKAIRAVASANGANAISILIPCHRIIGTNGNLVGYAGGLKTKEKLLLLERALQTNQLKLF